MDALPPPPPWPVAAEVRELGASPRWYRARAPIFGIGLRASPKWVARVERDDSLAANAFGFDVHAIGRFGLGRGRCFGLWPELGYAQTGTSTRLAGIGLGFASQTPTIGTTFTSGLSIGFVPRFLIGRRAGETAIGARTSVLAEIYLDDGNAWGVEVAHQLVRAGDVVTHEVMLGISITLMAKRW